VLAKSLKIVGFVGSKLDPIKDQFLISCDIIIKEPQFRSKIDPLDLLKISLIF